MTNGIYLIKIVKIYKRAKRSADTGHYFPKEAESPIYRRRKYIKSNIFEIEKVILVRLYTYKYIMGSLACYTTEKCSSNKNKRSLNSIYKLYNVKD